MKLLEQRGLTWSGLFRLFLNNFRESGVRVTLKKALAQLTRADVSFDIDRYRKWFSRYSTEEGTGAGVLFRKPSVVVIGALDIPQCKKYRVMQKVEYFAARDIPCDYTEYRDLTRAFSIMQLATVAILYRVPAGLELDALLQEAARLGLRVYYDIDDPIFDETSYRQNRNLESLSIREREHLLGQIPAYREVMQRIGSVIVSTSGMRERVQSATSVDEVIVWPNLIDSATRSVFQQLVPPERVESGQLILGYFSGSRAHDFDLEQVASVLAGLLADHDEVQIHLGGYTRLPADLEPFESRVTFLGFMSYHAYLERLSAVDIHIVPLVIDQFNDCKSGIRYLEASMCKVPTVASEVGQFTEMIEQGETGFLCRSEEDWRANLETLIANPGRRREIADAAHAVVNADYALTSTRYQHLGEAVTHVS